MEISHNVRKRTFGHVSSTFAQSDQTLYLGAFYNAKDAKFLHTDNEEIEDCVDAQAGSSLLCVHMLKGTVFSRCG